MGVVVRYGTPRAGAGGASVKDGARVVLVVVDGLRAGEAESCLGFTQAFVAARGGLRMEFDAELPCLSRPLYATLLTGRTPVETGITSNAIVRRLELPTVFGACRKAGLRTAAAAYHWFSELYNEAPFTPMHRVTCDDALPIQRGLFYWRDDYPDDHLFADAEWLRAMHDPHFLLVHPMGVDNAGHVHGGNSWHYRAAARGADDLLARHVPGWVEAGYTVVITSDHGMGLDGMHGGPGELERRVPFFVVGPRIIPRSGAKPKQTDVAGAICALLGLEGHSLPASGGIYHA